MNSDKQKNALHFCRPSPSSHKCVHYNYSIKTHSHLIALPCVYLFWPVFPEYSIFPFLFIKGLTTHHSSVDKYGPSLYATCTSPCVYLTHIIHFFQILNIISSPPCVKLSNNCSSEWTKLISLTLTSCNGKMC